MELAEPGAPRSLCPHCRAWPWLVSAPEGWGPDGAPLGLLGDCQAPDLPSERRLCSFINEEQPALGCWAPRGSQPPTWWEQEGCDCLGL